jgi:radical SAM superfamily enzyme YgiQ (UPF0313 family)
VLERLAERNIFAITSFIIGMDNDTPGVAERILEQIRSWPPGLPVFGQLTPFPSTPLYKRLQEDGRLVRPKHWLKFEKNTMAHEPLRMTIAQTHHELAYAWTHSYNAARNAEAVQAMRHAPVGPRIFHFITRLAFRAIYFPQTTRRAWLKVFFENKRTVFSLTKEAIGTVLTAKKRTKGKEESSPVITPLKQIQSVDQ